jgi:hypothetical protein
MAIDETPRRYYRHLDRSLDVAKPISLASFPQKLIAMHESRLEGTLTTEMDSQEFSQWEDCMLCGHRLGSAIKQSLGHLKDCQWKLSNGEGCPTIQSCRTCNGVSGPLYCQYFANGSRRPLRTSSSWFLGMGRTLSRHGEESTCMNVRSHD